jgi:hypothetical protein
MERESRFRDAFERFKKRNRNRKPQSLTRRIAERMAAVLLIAWLVIVFFPSPLFSHSIRIGRFDVHSDRPIPNAIHVVIAKAESRLATSPLFEDEHTFAIYIANDSWRMRVLYPLGNAGFGRSNLTTGYIALNRCDVKRDVCFRGAASPVYNETSLSSVIAHECTHQLIRKKLGLIGAVRLPKWKNEGYCEYVSDAPTVDENDGFRRLAEGRPTSSPPAFRYFTYFVAVRYLLDQQKLTLDELFGSKLDFHATLEAATARRAQGEPSVATEDAN